MIDYEALAAPFEFEDLEWRTLRVMDNNGIQAMIAPYVTARAIQDRLDKVCTPYGWWNEFREWKGGQICGITLVTHEFETEGGIERIKVTKWDGAKDTQIEALKGGLSDSMKRAAVQWGIGRYLYKLPPMKARILQKYEPGAYRGTDSNKKPFWWTPNAAAVKAIKEASK